MFNGNGTSENGHRDRPARHGDRGPALWRGVCWAAILVAASLLAGVCAAPFVGRSPAAEVAAPAGGTAHRTAPATLFARTSPAANPVTLALLADQRKVVGWISGAKSFTGREVVVQCDGAAQTVLVQDGNVFTWHYKLDKPTVATFTVGRLSQSLRLVPPPDAQPSAFFVVERTVYRPQQKLHFAAFLRRLNKAGRFVPVPNQPVKVLITSEKKKHTAGELALTSDGFGRIVGEYQFSPGDVLDNYLLSVAGHAGSAKVKLAEFRKSKIRLKIGGKVVDRSLRTLFEAVDFLDKHVLDSKVHFTVQVTRRPAEVKRYALNGADFVYHKEGVRVLPDPQGLSVEERLLWEVDPTFAPWLGGSAAQVVAQIDGDLDLAEGQAQHVMPVKADWQDGRHSVIVQGVLVDANGREQRAAEQIPLDGDSGKLRLALPKRYYETGEAIRVTAAAAPDQAAPGRPAGPVMLVAMRLTPTPQMPQYYGRGGYRGYQNALAVNQFPIYQLNQARLYGARSARLGRRWRHVQPASAIGRTMVAATTFTDGEAELKLAEPGAYVLVGMARRPDGTSVRSEAGCIVQRRDDLPGLVLKLDRDEYSSGDMLTGEVHSRFAGARALLTLRDSTGIRLWRPIQLAGGAARIRHLLGEDLRYGCSVEVQYADATGEVHVAEKFVRVVPEGRMLKIHTKMKEVCDAGEKVKIDLEVNRPEPVDLVVSVYDQSLLGIAPDRAVKITDFYLADERVRVGRDRELLRRRLAGATVGGLIEQLEKVLKDADLDRSSPEYQQLQNARGHYNSNNYLRSNDVAILLNLAGIKVRFLYPYYSGQNWYCRIDKSKAGRTTLFELIDTPHRDGWQLTYSVHGPTLVLAETHPSYAQHALLQSQAFIPYRGASRADSHWSVSANALYSVSGQSFISHVPVASAAGPTLIDVDPGQSGISVRRDFSDVAFWNAAVRTDRRGRASVEFKLPDSLTNWQVVVTAVSADMHVGSHKAKFTSTKPIMVWPMLPRVFTEGDKVNIYGSIHNRTDTDRTIDVQCKVKNGRLLSPVRASVFVKAGRNAPVYWTFQTEEPGFTQILMSAKCAAGSDASLKRLPVVASTAEEVVTASGFCRTDATLTVPKEAMDLDTTRLDICLAPSLAADMADTLDYLVAYPHGCVEQTMSRFLPAIEVAQVLRRYHIANKALKEKLPKCVAAGIKRLLQLQRDDGGWGWNGNGRTHEMMTPYALYGLLEAEKAGYRIGDEQAIKRGLERLKGFIDAMGEKQAADRIYCMYVYARRRQIQDAWWKFIADQLAGKKLSDYATALALEMAVRKGKKDLAGDLAGALRASAKKSAGQVFWTTAGFSRWGNDRNEITAAAMKSLVAYDVTDSLIAGVLTYFARTKRGNRWNSTKDTAMIVYAMCDYLAKQDLDLRGAKTVTVSVNGGKKTTVKLDDGLTKTVAISGRDLRAGDNRVRFENASAGVMYRMSLRYRKRGREIAPLASGIAVTRHFYLLDEKGSQKRQLKPGDVVPRGAYIESRVDARCTAGGGMRYVLLNNPKPSCCEILPTTDTRFNHASTQHVLREDKTAGVLYHHEQTGGSIQDRCVLHAELAGEYVVAPASVELMYQTETRGHSGTFHFKVADEEPLAMGGAE